MRVKEQVNRAIREYAVKFEEAVRRDHVLGESILATQMGKDKRLICKKDVHDTLQAFVNTIKNDFEMPELLLPINDYESTGVFQSDRDRRRTRSHSTSRKRKRSRGSSRAKSAKSIEPREDVESRRSRPKRRNRSHKSELNRNTSRLTNHSANR